MSNRLSESHSPYLLQHKDNPVDWYPWGDEAFEVAKHTDRPLFLSIGYAACHWCHVMEHESFENESLAEFLNKYFVSIKVDREERPDIDQIYMNAVQVMTGHGGWPMSVFLTHDRQPFYAGTYWPATARAGMPGFAQVLDALTDAWNTRREDVHEHASQITGALIKLAVGTAEPSRDLVANAQAADRITNAASNHLLEVFDPMDGGFGQAPKFPHATDLDFLLRRAAITGDDETIAAVTTTLNKMAGGGIFDHIGGGFSRYSVDAHWLVPHFEKMLYDNALLAEVYVRAFQVTRDERYAEVARTTLDYLCRDMVDDSGGFHCSEDADSEGVEGKFYVWRPSQVIEVLGQDRGDRFCQIYDITERGNFEGNSIANRSRSLEDWASDLHIDITELHHQLTEDRERLRIARADRIAPGRDDKIITAWNALAIRALAIAGGVLDEPRYVDAAVQAANFIDAKMRRPDGRLLHAYRQGTAHLDAYVDDYAYTIEAFAALYQTTGDDRWIQLSTTLADEMIEHFADNVDGGFFYTADDGEKLLTRNKDWHDGSLVSGNGSAVNALLTLSSLCSRNDFRDIASKTLSIAAAVLQKQSAACASLLIALDRFHHEQQQLVLAVESTEQLKKLRSTFLKRFRSHATLAWSVNGSSLVDLAEGKVTCEGQPTLYVCQDFTCAQPMIGDDALGWLGVWPNTLE